MDAITSIGKKLNGNEQRDAIHVAIASVEAGHDLLPGQRVRMVTIGGKQQAYLGYADEPHEGVVDPYLAEPVKEGERFWLFLIPGSIIGLRHDWAHPAFPSSAVNLDKAISEKWLRDYANRYSANYEEMISGAADGNGYCFGDDDGPPNYRGIEGEFWQHIENVTGRKFDGKHRDDTPFRCAC